MEKFESFFSLLKEFWSFELLHLENMTVSVYHIFGLLIIILLTRLIIKFTGKIISRQIKQKNLDEGRTLALYQIIKYIIIVAAILIGLDVIGIKFTLLLGGAAALLVGVGLGLQSTFNDIFSGIILLFERSISVGDILEVDGTVGRVVEINIRTSEVATYDNISILMPNSKLVNNSIINWSHNRQLTRFTVDVGVSYGSDVQLVKKLLHDAAVEHPDVDKTRPPDIFFSDFGDSALQFDLKFWCTNLLQIGRIRSDIRFAIDAKFREKGVTIPFPQRDLHLRSTVK
jgi:small-conductance mechanosensitive channel